MWCGAQEFPVTARVVSGWQGVDGASGYLLADDDGSAAAYGEVWPDDEPGHAELARLIVAPDRRGRGHGRELVRCLVAQARATGYRHLSLRVHPANAVALSCYRAAGFVPIESGLARQWNAGQPVEYVWLQPA